VATDAEIRELKARSRSAWDQSDYTLLAERLLPASVELVRACGIGPGMRVLDVAAGSGNAAATAARAGASVVASDLSPAMVELGRSRTAAEGLEVEWVEGDAEELPFGDGEFDCVTSVFGAQFAPRPERAAAELARVVRPGGTIGMSNWPGRGFQREVFDVMSRYRDDEPDGIPPSGLWGDEEVVRERFGDAIETVTVEPRMLPYRFDSLAQMAEVFQRGAPRVQERAALPEEVRNRMVAEFVEVIQRYDTAEGDALAIDAEYAIVVARKRS
jgi:SAM-dependent methyltransferase